MNKFAELATKLAIYRKIHKDIHTHKHSYDYNKIVTTLIII